TGPEKSGSIDRRLPEPGEGGPPTDDGVEDQNARLDHARRGYLLVRLLLDRPVASQPSYSRLVLVQSPRRPRPLSPARGRRAGRRRGGGRRTRPRTGTAPR